MSATLNTDKLRSFFGSGVGEVHMEGRTYPVQRFYLEDCLRVTKYVEADSGGVEDELERKGYKRGKFMCEMCERAVFETVEELGVHYGTCMGVGDMGDLEDRLRRGGGLKKKKEKEKEKEKAEVEFEDYEDFEDYEEYGGEDDEGDEEDNPDKWDGVSEFTIVKETTVTDDELVALYQSRFNDEEIDYSLITSVMSYIVGVSGPSDAVLVFLPGWHEILTLSSTLQDSGFTMPKFKILPLHSGVPAREQREVFLRPPSGARKIVLSTNIAETSVTIDDISFVIDSAKAKEKGYDPHLNTATLSAQWISLASLQQRAGRAGRCKAGVCFSLVSRQVRRGVMRNEATSVSGTSADPSSRFLLAIAAQQEPEGIPGVRASQDTSRVAMYPV